MMSGRSCSCTELSSGSFFRALGITWRKLSDVLHKAIGFKNRHQYICRDQRPFINLLSLCLFLKPYIKAVEGILCRLDPAKDSRPLSVCKKFVWIISITSLLRPCCNGINGTSIPYIYIM